jgi:hypothetical protein
MNTTTRTRTAKISRTTTARTANGDSFHEALVRAGLTPRHFKEARELVAWGLRQARKIKTGRLGACYPGGRSRPLTAAEKKRAATHYENEAKRLAGVVTLMERQRESVVRIRREELAERRKVSRRLVAA